jgi:hypothetical protein
MQHEDDSTDSRSAAKPTNKRWRAKGWILAGIVIAAVAIGWAAYSRLETDAVAKTGPAALPPAPQVIVSKPLVRDLDSRLGFLGQFSAVEQVELRAQVGGTLTGIHFKDGDIVHQGDLLFTIDARPYEIKLAQANAQLETASARLALANRDSIALRSWRLKRSVRNRPSTSAPPTGKPHKPPWTTPRRKSATRSSISSTAASWPPSLGALARTWSRLATSLPAAAPQPVRRRCWG